MIGAAVEAHDTIDVIMSLRITQGAVGEEHVTQRDAVAR